MTVKELRDKDDAALKHELKDKQKHLFDLRSQSVTEKLEDPTQLHKTKRQIAQIKTILRQREPATQKKQKPATATAVATATVKATAAAK